MSCSRIFKNLQIKTSVFIIRLIGWFQSGDFKRNKAKGESLKAKILTDYFARRYLPAIENLPKRDITVEKPETIWQFWDSPRGRETPAIVKSSIASVDRFKGSFDHIVLNNKTLEQHADLPGFVLDKFKKGKIDYTHFSDLLRLNLLKNHGGVWLDATAYMTNFVPKHIIDEDFFVFLTGERTHYPYSFIQSCFIRSKKGSFLCEAWHQMCIEFWKKETKKIEYFQIHLMFKALVERHEYAKSLFDHMPHISEDGIQQLVGDNLLRKFDLHEWEKIKKSSFFQKTTYKVQHKGDLAGTYFSKLSEGQW